MIQKKNDFLLAIIKQYFPNSILEIGCNCGNKLYILAKNSPKAKLVGIDINLLAVDKGNKWLKQENINNVELIFGRAEKLDRFRDNSFDVVFSWATLIYTRPSKIEKVLKDMLRISKKGLILLEMQTENKKKSYKNPQIYCKGNWKRDYVSILRKLDNNAKEINITWIPPDIWLPGGGGAAVISIQK